MRTCAECDSPALNWGRCTEHYAALPASSRGRRKLVSTGAAAELRKQIRGKLVECARCKGKYVASQVDIDHRTPLYKGGEDVADNLQILCRELCHRVKTDLDAGRVPF